MFLDLKLHEIPNSVAAGVQAAGKLGASMVTVHASAGSAVLRVAVRAAAQFPNLKVLALTVITSLSDQDLPEIGLAPSVQQQVQRLALLAASAGCQGVVASVQNSGYPAGRIQRVVEDAGFAQCERPMVQGPGLHGKEKRKSFVERADLLNRPLQTRMMGGVGGNG